MIKERLERAERVVQELIDRGVSTGYDPGEEPDVADMLDITSWGYYSDCGTVACLGGWMTLDPKLREMGLRHYGDLHPGSCSLEPQYAGEGAIGAVMEFFGLDGHEATYIFGGDNPNSLDAGLSRIQRVLRGEYDPYRTYPDEGSR
jgi:hypothetical protein